MDIIVRPTGIRLLYLVARFIVGKTYSVFSAIIRERVPPRIPDRPAKLRKTAISRLHWEKKKLATMINRREMHENGKTVQSCLNDGFARDLER